MWGKRRYVFSFLSIYKIDFLRSFWTTSAVAINEEEMVKWNGQKEKEKLKKNDSFFSSFTLKIQ